MNSLKISLLVILTSAGFVLPQNNLFSDFTLYDIFFSDINHGWAVGSNGVVVKTTNGGENWKIINTPISEYFLSEFFVNKDTGWAITPSSKRIYITRDGGETWENISTIGGSNPDLLDIFFVNDSTGYICGSDQFIHKTTDFGYHWQDISGSFYGSSVIEFVNENYGWMGGFNSIKRTTNGGNSWSSIDLLTYEFQVCELYLLDQNHEYLVGYGFDNLGTYYNAFMATNNGGNSFSYKIFDTPLWDVYFNSPSVGWIAGPTTYKTADGGQNWHTLNPELKRFVFIENKSWGINFNNDILYSENGWEEYSVQFSFTSDVEYESYDFEFSLSQNYPNPFNPTTKIKFTLTPSLSPGERVSEGRVRATLKVYDVLGNEIVTLVNEEKSAGNYEVEFDGTGLPSGIYFYQLKAGSYVETKKMLLLK